MSGEAPSVEVHFPDRDSDEYSDSSVSDGVEGEKSIGDDFVTISSHDIGSPPEELGSDSDITEASCDMENSVSDTLCCDVIDTSGIENVNLVDSLTTFQASHHASTPQADQLAEIPPEKYSNSEKIVGLEVAKTKVNDIQIVRSGHQINPRIIASSLLVASIAFAVSRWTASKNIENGELSVLEKDADMRHQEQMQLLASKFAEERAQWKEHMKKSNEMLEEIKNRLNEKQVNNIEYSDGEQRDTADGAGTTDGVSDTTELIAKLSKLVEQYSLSAEDIDRLEQLLAENRSTTDMTDILAKTLSSAKGFIEESMRGIREALNSTEIPGFGDTVKDNTSKAMNVSQVVIDEMLSILGEKIEALKNISSDITVKDIEDLVSTHAKVTADKLSHVAAKASKKLEKLGADIASSKSGKKLREGTEKALGDMARGFFNFFTGSNSPQENTWDGAAQVEAEQQAQYVESKRSNAYDYVGRNEFKKTKNKKRAESVKSSEERDGDWTTGRANQREKMRGEKPTSKAERVKHKKYH